MNRSHRTRHASEVSGWAPAPGWGQQLPGWNPLLDHGPLPLRAAGSVARWWWPTLAVAGFLAVVVYVTGHDPGPSRRGLLTIALAALVVVLLTIHRNVGPSRLARAAAEYTVVALLAALLTLAASDVDQPPATSAGSEARHAATEPKLHAGDDRRPGVLRVAAGVARAVTGAVGWLVELWRQADATTDHPNPPSATTPEGEAMPSSPALASTSTRRPL